MYFFFFFEKKKPVTLICTELGFHFTHLYLSPIPQIASSHWPPNMCVRE